MTTRAKLMTDYAISGRVEVGTQGQGRETLSASADWPDETVGQHSPVGE